jgi:hypothetical protein
MRRGGVVFLRAVMWAVMGTLYAVLFLGLLEALAFVASSPWGLLIAAVAAGTITASFYGALPLAMVGTMAGVVSTMGYLLAFPGPVDPLRIVAVSGTVGGICGAVIAFPLDLTRGTAAKTLAGLASGLAAGLLVLPLAWILQDELPIGIVTGLLVAVTGILYVIALGWLLTRLRHQIPRGIVEMALPAGFAMMVGLSMWTIGGSVTGAVDPELRQVARMILEQVPEAGLGGALGGALSGALLEVFRAKRAYSIEL